MRLSSSESPSVESAPPGEPAGGDTSPAASLPAPFAAHDYIRLGGLSPATASVVWLLLSLVLLVAGIFLNWLLTGGAWVVPQETGSGAGPNPFGEDSLRGLTSHPYDVLTAVLFVASILLIGGSLLVAGPARHGIRIAGWLVFAFHWGATAMNFYHVEEGDIVNAVFAMAAVFLLVYFAYHELVSLRVGRDYPALRFSAAAVTVASVVWFFFLKVPFATEWIIEVVAGHTVWMLRLFDQNVVLGIDSRSGFEAAISYPGGLNRTIIIILACTAIQSMMIFVAAAIAVQPGTGDQRIRPFRWMPAIGLPGRRVLTVAVTVPIVYVLNLLRNTTIVWWWATGWAESQWTLSSDQSFSIAHNYIGKGGSLVALVFIAFLVFRLLPELYDAILGLFDLPRNRRGPLEKFFRPVVKPRKGKAPAAAETVD